MKTTMITLLAALASTTIAGPTLRRADASDVDTSDAVGITFRGPAFAGGEDVHLTGTAEEIYKQLVKINPNYDADMANVTLPDEETSVAQQSPNLSKRDGITCNPVGDRVGNWITQCAEGFSYLGRLTGWCGAPKGHGGCSRVSCSHSCGIFLCNDNSYPIEVRCSSLVPHLYDIVGECAQDYNDWVSSVKGQKFVNTNVPDHYNVIIKDQSC